jgi:pentatricopeptide repeat protein
VIDSYGEFIEAEYVSMDSKDKFYDRNYWTLIDRQKTFVTKSIERCKELSIEWLIHIDTDELLWCGDSVLDLVNNVSKDVDYITVKNYEAVYTSDDLENPFLQTNTFISSGMTAYDSGKSIGRISPNLEFRGSHAFTGKHQNIETKKAVVLHFESATFEKWFEKFNNITNSYNSSDIKGMKEYMIDDVKSEIKEVPITFYRDSSRLVKLGDLKKCREYYNKMKVSRYNPNTWKLYWTPLLPEKNSHWLR